MHLTKSISAVATVLSMSWITVGQAADLASRGGASPLSRAAIWEGVYVGVALDANGQASTINAFGAAKKFDATGDSITGAVFVGYNFQSGPWVYGIEADWSFGGGRLSKADPTLGTVKVSHGNLASFRARGGYAFDSLLIYGTAGVAFLDREIKASAGGSDSDVQTGIVVGLGAEYLFTDDWTGRAEVLAYGFGESDVTLGGASRKVADGVGTVRIGIARKF
jgi:outer membrane immunogenic protein